MTNTDHAARWAWLRQHTPALAGRVYLNAGFQGPISEPVAAAMHEWLDREVKEGPTSRPVLDARRAMATRYRELMAHAFGADPDEMAITDNTTHGMNMVTAGLSVEAGDGVVTSGVEHASGLVPVYALRERRGADLHIVPVTAEDSPGTMLEAFGRALDARTRLVLISGVSYSTGQRLPEAEIAALAHQQNPNAFVLIDGAQTAGHEPLDMHASGVDAHAFPMHKWLCGPGGLGALYIRRDRIADIEPAAMSFHGAKRFDFAGGFEPERNSIEKFELTTVSGVLLAGGIAAVEQYIESGPQAVWDRVRELNVAAERRIGGIPGVTVTSPTSDATRSGLFAFRVEGIPPSEVSAQLWLAGKVVCRAVAETNCVRLTLHVYNNESDIDVVAGVIEDAIKNGVSEAARELAAIPFGQPAPTSLTPS
ncbi:MAG: aminotransferase class V-fold PLP-dependent enzyme [Dehalococcoidia bacterium]